MTTTQPSLFTSRRVHGTARLTEYGVAAPVGGGATTGRVPTKYARAMAQAFLDHDGVLYTDWPYDDHGNVLYPEATNQQHRCVKHLRDHHGVRIERKHDHTTDKGTLVFSYTVSADQWAKLARIAGGKA